MNASKTKYMSFNHNGSINIQTNDGTKLENVSDFKYLGALMESSEKDVKVRKAAAWRACSKLNKIWKSTLPRGFKQRLFAATVESVLLYGCEAWTVTPKLSKDLDGCYTRLLRTVFNVNWKQHITNKELYGSLPKVSEKIRDRRLRFAGHCCRPNVRRNPYLGCFCGDQSMGRGKPADPLLPTQTYCSKTQGLALAECAIFGKSETANFSASFH